jgi:hypothetical protein
LGDQGERHRSTDCYGHDMLEERDLIQVAAADVMLFDDEVVPVRAGTGEDDPGGEMVGQKLAVSCSRERNTGRWCHHKLSQSPIDI